MVHDFESEPVPKYVVRLCRSSDKAETKLLDVVYNTNSLDGGRSVFGHVVEDMTSMVRLEGSEKGLEGIVRTLSNTT